MTEGSAPKPVWRMECPRCKSARLETYNWHEAVRKKCLDCGKTFNAIKENRTQNTPIKKKSPYGRCPKCGSADTLSRGTTSKGKRRAACRDCGAMYYVAPVDQVRAEIRNERLTEARPTYPPCKACGSKNVMARSTVSKKRRFKCNDCGKQFAEQSGGQTKVAMVHKLPATERITGTCGHCGSPNTTPNGSTPAGCRRFKCLDCKRTSVDRTQMVKQKKKTDTDKGERNEIPAKPTDDTAQKILGSTCSNPRAITEEQTTTPTQKKRPGR